MAALNKVIAFAATENPDQAKLFYRDKLGFKFLSDDGFALVFDLQGMMLRIAKMKDFTPAPYTILVWEVAASEESVTQLTAKGVSFERFPGMLQDKLGIWPRPSEPRSPGLRTPMEIYSRYRDTRAKPESMADC